ncbi:hypothetical protein [Amycolatopsis sp. cmx-11-12]|uniref:hypothetical protein n=1 Tax=Amycolatopsis sp. cmx-11-12 TaxID=2785795 RepID=UPI0039181EAE
MRLGRLVVVVLGTTLTLSSCGAIEKRVLARDTGAGQQARTLAEAIIYPRQEDVAGLTRAALQAALGKSGDFSVLEVRDIGHGSAQEPMAAMIWRIHLDEVTSIPTSPAVDVCYHVEFDYYGASSGPRRVPCPANAVPVTPPPPSPSYGIPQGYIPALETILGKLPAAANEADVRTALAAGLPAPAGDSNPELMPKVSVRVREPMSVWLCSHAPGPGPARVTGSTHGTDISATVPLALNLTQFSAFGVPVLKDSKTCESVISARLTGRGFSFEQGGTLIGTYGVPPFTGCGVATGIVNSFLDADGNTLALTLSP